MTQAEEGKEAAQHGAEAIAEGLVPTDRRQRGADYVSKLAYIVSDLPEEVRAGNIRRNTLLCSRPQADAHIKTRDKWLRSQPPLKVHGLGNWTLSLKVKFFLAKIVLGMNLFREN
jgi:hypothetical protein